MKKINSTRKTTKPVNQYRDKNTRKYDHRGYYIIARKALGDGNFHLPKNEEKSSEDLRPAMSKTVKNEPGQPRYPDSSDDESDERKISEKEKRKDKSKRKSKNRKDSDPSDSADSSSSFTVLLLLWYVCEHC